MKQWWAHHAFFLMYGSGISSPVLYNLKQAKVTLSKLSITHIQKKQKITWSSNYQFSVNFTIYPFNTVDNSNLFGDFIVDSATFIDKGTGTCSIAYSSSESGRSTALTVRLFLGAVLSVVFRPGSSVVRVRWFPPFSSAASDDMSSLPCPYILSLSLGNPSVEWNQWLKFWQ